MRATFISRQATDLTAVNAARASMGKVRTVFDNTDKKGSDKNLLAYLHRENHFTPFTHQRETFDMRAHNVKFAHMSETDTAGMVKSHSKGRVKIRHSIYGWVNLIKNGLLDPDSADDIAWHLHRLYPHTAKALMLPPGKPSEHAVHLPSSSEQDHRFIDVTLHIKVPFFVIRQLDTHKVGFARNEQSGRYIEFVVEYFKFGWRNKPDGNVKQGSGTKANLLQRIVSSVAYCAVRAVTLPAYHLLIACGIAKEQARGLLPMACYTEYYWTASLASYGRMYHLRNDPHAQAETGDIAALIEREVYRNTGIAL